MFPQARIEGFDMRQPNPAVLAHVERMGFGGRVRLHYKISQTDPNVRKIVEEKFGQAVDIVVDDASHLYPFSRTTFEMLFPIMRENGLYVLEDWAWAHWLGTGFDHWDGEALSNLVFEFVMASASAGGIFAEVLANSRAAVVRRGPQPVREPMSLDALIKIAPRRWSKLTL